MEAFIEKRKAIKFFIYKTKIHFFIFWLPSPFTLKTSLAVSFAPKRKNFKPKQTTISVLSKNNKIILFYKIRTIWSKIKNFLGVNERGNRRYKIGSSEMPTKWLAPASLTRPKRSSPQAYQPRPDLDYQNSTVNWVPWMTHYGECEWVTGVVLYEQKGKGNRNRTKKRN